MFALLEPRARTKEMKVEKCVLYGCMDMGGANDNFGKEKNNEKLSKERINCIVCHILFSSIFLKVHAWEGEIFAWMYLCYVCIGFQKGN